MVVDLEQFVNNVRTLSQQGNYRELSEFIVKSSESLAKNKLHLDTVLETLDLQHHSLGILAVLCVKLSLSNTNVIEFETIYSQVQEFISGCNAEQIRYALDTFFELCHLFCETLIEIQYPMRGIDLMCCAIRKIRSSEAQLTSIHSDLCHLCLQAKCIKPALEFLDIDITEISQEGGYFESKHYLLYYYYGGMIYTAVKQFERALYFFEVSITTPALAVSHIMLEAYKKYILVSLILYGRVQGVPKYTSQVVGRFIKPLSQPYHDLATVYASNNSDEVHSVINKHQEVFQRDRTYGLVKQVQASINKKNIQRLTKTFLTLSLADMANRVHLHGPQEAETYIFNMIAAGDIFATINQKDGMVIFHDNPQKYNSSIMLKQLQQEMSECIDLSKKVEIMEEEIMTNPQYVKKSCGSQDEDPATASVSSTKMPSYSM